MQHDTLKRALQRHLERLGRRLDVLEGISRRYSWARLAVALGGGGVALWMYAADATGAGWGAALTVVVFMGLAHYHGRVRQSIRRHQLWRQIKATHLARMTLDWDRIPHPAASDVAPQHAFAADLHVTGPHSLHHLLDTAISQGGSMRLMDWLLNTRPDPAVVAVRQALLAELRGLDAFRDRLALEAALVAEKPGEQWDGERLIQWLRQHTAPKGLVATLLVLTVLAGVNITLVVLHVMGVWPAYWGYSFLVYAALYLFRHRDFGHAFDEALHLEQMLTQFGAVVRHVEGYHYGRRAHLKALCGPFHGAATRPSQHLRRVARIAALTSIQHNEIIGPLLNAIVPWDLFFTYRLHQQKETLRAVLPTWLDVWYELEALSALATFADLHPHYTMPVIPGGGGPPVFEARGLGHPLLPEEEKVCNDFRLDALGTVIIVTGSNMSGKSTFLRTLGVNLVLAYAGAPVNAGHLQAVPFRLFSCIQVSDALGDGISYFYAEVRRLKALLQAYQAEDALPLFGLVDEIFRGTNNRERLHGSRAYIQALVGGHGVSLIATHDLELVHLADADARVANYHFREEVKDGRMVFDYRLHEGPCPTTNAIKIMQMEGLPVKIPDPSPET